MSGITDVHTHAFPDTLARRAIEALEGGRGDGDKAALDGTVSGLLRSMDRAGVERSVICSIATAPKQVESILNWSLSVQSQRIVPFASVHPDTEDMAGAVRRIAESGLLGIKLHPMYQGFTLDDSRMWPCYEAVQQCGLVLTLHCGRDFAFPPEDMRARPERVLAVHRAFPDIPLIATHMGGWQMWDEVARCLAGTGVYLETSYSLDRCPDATRAAIMAEHPRDRILFGTDSPWQDQQAMVALVRETFPDAGRQRAILCDSADRLLREAAERIG